MPDESKFAALVRQELEGARSKHAPMMSAHHAYAVILEELDEFWDEVKRRGDAQSPLAMLGEIIQVAAMCQRAAEDLGLPIAQMAQARRVP